MSYCEYVILILQLFTEIVIASQSYIYFFLCNVFMVVTQSFKVCVILGHVNTDHGFKSSWEGGWMSISFFFPPPLLLVFLNCTTKIEALQWVDTLLKEFCRMSEKYSSFQKFIMNLNSQRANPALANLIVFSDI